MILLYTLFWLLISFVSIFCIFAFNLESQDLIWVCIEEKNEAIVFSNEVFWWEGCKMGKDRIDMEWNDRSPKKCVEAKELANCQKHPGFKSKMEAWPPNLADSRGVQQSRSQQLLIALFQWTPFTLDRHLCVPSPWTQYPVYWLL